LQRRPQPPTEQLFQFREVDRKIFLEFRAKRFSQRRLLAHDPVEALQGTQGVEGNRMRSAPQRHKCRRWMAR
jgi:hypothetical protein